MASEPLKHDPNFKGPVAKRSCTDVFFLIIFLLFWVGMGFLGWQALTTGDPRILMYPKDTRGQFCGVDNSLTASSKLNLADKPFLYFVDPFDTSALQICVATCPAATVAITTPQTAVCDYAVIPDASNMTTVWANKKCSAFVYASKPILSRCVPTDIQALVQLGLNGNFPNSSIVQAALDQQEVAQQIVGDFSRSWQWFLAFAGIALVISTLWLVLMRFFTTFMVWSTALLGLLSLDGFAVFFYFAWNDAVLRNKSGIPVSEAMVREEQTYMGLFIALAAVAAGSNLIVFFLRKRIRIAVQIVKEATTALQAMPLMVIFPVFTFIAMLAVFGYWVIVELCIAAAQSDPTIFGFQYQLEILKYLQWYNLFGLFWGQQFLSGVSQTTLAGAVATWYWARDKRALPSMPVLTSLGRVLRYHMGSIALGSLVIALVQVVRVFVWQVQRQLRGAQNKVAKGLFACCQCCFVCAETVLKFMNRNAYIEIAVYGTSFCKSAKNAFQLLLRNGFRLVSIDSVAGFIMFLGRVFVAALCGIGSYYWLQYYYVASPLNYTSASVFVIMLIGYVVASLFLFVVDIAIDTVFLCFCEDCERNDGTDGRPYFMSERLKALTSVKNAVKKAPTAIQTSVITNNNNTTTAAAAAQGSKTSPEMGKRASPTAKRSTKVGTVTPSPVKVREGFTREL